MIRHVRESATKSVIDILLDNGRLINSQLGGPHRGSNSDHHSTDSFHIHSLVGKFRFQVQDTKRTNGRPSLVERFSSWSQRQQYREVTKFFEAPYIELTPEIKHEIAYGYIERLREKFGKRLFPKYNFNYVAPVESALLWTSPKMLCGGGNERYVMYMKNPHLFVLKYKIVSYNQKTGMVGVRTRQPSPIPHLEYYGDVYETPLLDFCKRFLVTPLRGFHKVQFPSSGGYHGNSKFNPILKFLPHNHDVERYLGWDSSLEQSHEERLDLYVGEVENDYWAT